LPEYINKDRKDLAMKALRLPKSLKQLEDGEDEGNDLFFSPNIFEKMQQDLRNQLSEEQLKNNLGVLTYSALFFNWPLSEILCF
jgi:hypothetical protein